MTYLIEDEAIEINEETKQRLDSAVISSGQDVPMTESESLIPKHSEIDQTMSGFETAQDAALDKQESKEEISEVQAVIYEPEKPVLIEGTE